MPFSATESAFHEEIVTGNTKIYDSIVFICILQAQVLRLRVAETSRAM